MAQVSRPVSLVTVDLPSDLRAIAEEAARRWRPDANVAARGSIDTALAPAGDFRSEVLVLGPTVSRPDAERAAGALAPDGLPRWPVIVCGEGEPLTLTWFVPRARWTAEELVRVIPQARELHAAVRDARRAQGDLWTIARRMSHEMRSPLGCILTSADVIREEFADTPTAAGGLTEPIIESAKEVMHLVERLTFLARATVTPLVATPLDMAMIVWAARERLGRLIHETGAEISEPENWPTAVGCAEWVERIWLSLVENALRHAGPRPRIELGWTTHAGTTRYFVRDFGPGVPREIAASFFRPFHLLHLNDSGRGLGLSIVQRLVDVQGGTSGYEPVEPQGACFHFSLPEKAGDA